MKTVFTETDSYEILSEEEYDYQDVLTPILDKLEGDFDQGIINEIVLWKVNRYAAIDSSALAILNSIKKEATVLDEQFTREILEKLLPIKGIQLPMASTILRFKNPNIYQIIDQRVYRYIKGVSIKTPYAINKQINYYLDYLKSLREVCEKYNVPFSESDRIFYERDKKDNKDQKLKNF